MWRQDMQRDDVVVYDLDRPAGKQRIGLFAHYNKSGEPMVFSYSSRTGRWGNRPAKTLTARPVEPKTLGQTSKLVGRSQTKACMQVL
jgi:hypothetical protein